MDGALPEPPGSIAQGRYTFFLPVIIKVEG
jgi:hypothetical protein